jgi:hypothetical protein
MGATVCCRDRPSLAILEPCAPSLTGLKARAAPVTDADAARLLTIAMSLGRRDVALFAGAHGISTGEARRQLQRQRQVGRRYSRCVDELLT